MEQTTLESWKKLLAPGATNRDAFTRDSIDTDLSRRRKALHADGDSHLETLLINRILSAWLQVTYADGEDHQKRVDRAQRQILRAIQALATVRRLLRPTQVNIGQNQINVAG